MALSKPLSETLLPGERQWLTVLTSNLADDSTPLVYADWLEERGDQRSHFLRTYAQAARSMEASAFPPDDGLSEEWLELIGYRLLKHAADAGEPELKEPILRLARPALRMNSAPLLDDQLPVGTSKIGGLPDLPPGFPWPIGDHCRAIYNDPTTGIDRLAGFLAQVNFAELAGTQATLNLPQTGLLSFFSFQDIENDRPDTIGARAVYFPDLNQLVRTSPPQELTEGNGIISPQRLTFAETLDLPEPYDGPWSADLKPDPDTDYLESVEHFCYINFHNFLGYGRSTSGGDPTPTKQSRHLIVLSNAVECQLHIQIHQDDLAALKFDKITLNWVDFG